MRGINEKVSEKQLVWYLALNRDSVVRGCYDDDVDDGREIGEREGEGKEMEKEEEEGDIAHPSAGI